MKYFLYIFSLLCSAHLCHAQVEPNRMMTASISEELQNPVTLVYHSMGNVNVKGHGGNVIIAYSQDILPSLSSNLAKKKREDIYKELSADDFKEREIQLKKSSHFIVEQQKNVTTVKTNVYSFNSNIYVLTPFRSSVAVNVKDMGSIVVENINGSVEANTTSGDIYLKDATGIINANTNNGNIVADFSEERKQPLFVSTFVGNIEVIVPKSTSNSVLASSEMGSLYSNFNEANGLKVNATNQHVKNRKINFELNGGGTEFVIYTFKGDIYLRHLDR